MVGWLAGCAAAPRVDVARAPQTDFSAYATFSFHEPLGTDREQGTTSILSQNLMQATRAELEARGYRYMDDGADLQINFFVETKEVVESLRRRPDVAFSYGLFHRHYGVWTGYDRDVEQYTEGTLHVDVVDAGRNRLVWEGISRARGDAADFAFDPQRVRAVVARVFGDFPPRATDTL
ncbi:MAG: DUF4136 domain-containing protein [Gammaproteobacteria bacterium]|nr:DUF4136 domain-containing protein [Gammaproteobacteria bacterium]